MNKLKEAIRINQKTNKINTKVKTVSEKDKELKKNTYAFLTYSSGEDSTDVVPFERYYGVAPCKIVAVNPTAEEIKEITGRDMRIPDYVSEGTTFDGKPVAQARIMFLVKTSKEHCGIERFEPVTFLISKNYYTNGEKTKIRVIDQYRRTAWLTNEEYKARAIPQYKTGPADIDAGSYRPMFRGEENFINFLAMFYGIQDVSYFNNDTGKFETNPNLDKCKLQFTVNDFEAFFKGDVTTIRNFVKSRSENMVKIMFGIKTIEDGRRFTDVFLDCFLRYSAYPNRKTGTYYKFERAVNEAKVNNKYINTEFYCGPYKKYEIEASTITPTAVSMPVTEQSPLERILNEDPEDKLPWE